MTTIGGDGFAAGLPESFRTNRGIGPTNFSALAGNGTGNTGIVREGTIGVLGTGHVVTKATSAAENTPTSEVGVMTALTSFLRVTEFVAAGQGTILVKADTNQVGDGGVTNRGLA